MKKTHVNLKRQIILSTVSIALSACSSDALKTEVDNNIKTTAEKTSDLMTKTTLSDNKKKIFIRKTPYLSKNWKNRKNKLDNGEDIIFFNAKKASLTHIFSILEDNNIKVNVFDKKSIEKVVDAPIKHSGTINDFIEKIENAYSINITPSSATSINVSVFEHKIFYISRQDIEVQNVVQNTQNSVQTTPQQSNPLALYTNQTKSQPATEKEKVSTDGGMTENLWGDIDANLKMLLGDKGSYSISKGTGMISVYARPHVIPKIQQYIDTIEEKITQQVMLDVQIFSVRVSKKNALNFSVNTLFNNGTFSIATGAPSALNAGLSGGAITGTITNGTALNGTNLVFDRLNNIGDASVVEKTTAITINGQTAPIKMTTDISYAKNRRVVTGQTTSGTNSLKSWVEIETDTIETGFEMKITPQILTGNRILIDYNLSKKELLSLESFGDTVAQVQVPKISTRSFKQKAILRSNQTLVIAGFQTDTNQNKKRDGLTSTQGSSESDKQIFIIVFTPKILKL